MTARRYVTLMAALVALAVLAVVILGLPVIVVSAAWGWW